jgi:hypothetical protein
MPIFRDTSTVGVPRKWSLSDEDLKLVDTELVHFYSDGSRLAGDIYKPKNVNANDKYPAIVLVDGFTGIKEVYQVNYAVAFAKAGYVVNPTAKEAGCTGMPMLKMFKMPLHLWNIIPVWTASVSVYGGHLMAEL